MEPTIRIPARRKPGPAPPKPAAPPKKKGMARIRAKFKEPAFSVWLIATWGSAALAAGWSIRVGDLWPLLVGLGLYLITWAVARTLAKTVIALADAKTRPEAEP